MSSLEEELDALGGDLLGAVDDLLLNVAVLDKDGTIRWQNRRSREVRGDIVGQDFSRFVGADELEQYREFLTRIVCQGEPAEFTLYVRDASGQPVLTEVSASPIKDGQTVVGVFGLGRPVGASEPQPTPAQSELTERQLAVLRLLADGSSTHEIASALSLSPTTVRNYIAKILATLGVHTRLQAVVVAKRRGLV